METVDRAIGVLLGLFTAIADAVLAGLGAIEQWLRVQLASAGAPPSVQTAIMIAVAILLLLAVLRVFGGLIRVLLVIFLILLALRIVLPLAHA